MSAIPNLFATLTLFDTLIEFGTYIKTKSLNFLHEKARDGSMM